MRIEAPCIRLHEEVPEVNATVSFKCNSEGVVEWMKAGEAVVVFPESFSSRDGNFPTNFCSPTENEPVPT
jgi:hypothetical protein